MKRDRIFWSMMAIWHGCLGLAPVFQRLMKCTRLDHSGHRSFPSGVWQTLWHDPFSAALEKLLKQPVVA